MVPRTIDVQIDGLIQKLKRREIDEDEFAAEVTGIVDEVPARARPSDETSLSLEKLRRI